ncbi:MAG: hypothetical protein HN576_01200 [Bacteriovoracaceae bacterium]|jgi:hypothetical protein|nr:hypothetical protein [Bacteriovoracaceae bacterium]
MESIQKEFLGETFTYTTEVNEDGKALWTNAIDNEFSKWLYQLRAENRELFKVQYSVSGNAYKVLEKLKERIGVFDDSLLVRAITITFINFIDTRKGRPILNKLNKYVADGDLDVLQEGETLKKSLYFSSVGIRDIEAYSNLSGYKRSKVVKNALYSVLLISINEDEEIKNFWEQEILSQLTNIVKAA